MLPMMPRRRNISRCGKTSHLHLSGVRRGGTAMCHTQQAAPGSTRQTFSRLLALRGCQPEPGMGNGAWQECAASSTCLVPRESSAQRWNCTIPAPRDSRETNPAPGLEEWSSRSFAHQVGVGNDKVWCCSWPKPKELKSWDHKMVWVGRNLKDDPVPAPCLGQGNLLGWLMSPSSHQHSPWDSWDLITLPHISSLMLTWEWAFTILTKIILQSSGFLHQGHA